VNSPTAPCPTCGHTLAAEACTICAGSALALDGRTLLRAPRAGRLLDFAAGFGDVRAAFFALLHGREYIGLLRVPVAVNTIAFTAVALGGWLLLEPLFAAAFASSWWLLDGVRAHHAQHGPALWLVTSWLMLGHPLLDLIAGGLQEPLHEATERRMLGPLRAGAPATAVLRLRERARVFALLLLAWPFALGLALVPWVGLCAVGLLGAAVAAVVWFEAPMASRGWSLARRLRSLRDHRWRALGTGLGLQVATIVPFVNVLGLAPIATIAATASFLQFTKSERC
jgi:hypothetical protein